MLPIFLNDKKTTVEYYVNVEALDETGESHEQELNINLSNRPVNINLPMPEVVDRNNNAPIFVSMTNEFSGPVKKALDIRIYKMSKGRETDNDMNWPPPDLWNENRGEWQRTFPEITFDGFSQSKADKTLIYKTSLSADADKRFVLPAELLTSGFYRIEAVSQLDGKMTGETGRNFSVYDTKENDFPGKEFEWLSVNAASKGDTLKLISGCKRDHYFSIYHMAYRAEGKNGVSAKYDYVLRTDKKGLNDIRL